jgi:hypothetical protein
VRPALVRRIEVVMQTVSVHHALAGKVAVGSQVEIRGWVRTRRDSKAGISFVQVTDGSCQGTLQVVAPNTLANYTDGVLKLSAGASLIARGTLVASQGKGQTVEVQADAIEICGLVDDPDYAALLGLYGTNLLWKTGSRPVIRAREDRLGAPEITHPSQMRAIPNNAVLQQLGMMSNMLYGVGRAIAHDPARAAEMIERSPRFRRAMTLVEHARAASDLDVLRAYLSHYDPGMWLTRSGRARNEARSKELALLSTTVEGKLRV